MHEWTWVGGNSVVDSTGISAGVYGTLGVPSAGNTPGGRVDIASWTDKSGNLWLFGGLAPTSPEITYLNDLWKFDTSTNEWTWMGGSSAPGCGSYGCGQAGSYGAVGEMDANNIPGGRESAVSWVDASGNFFLYGGDGFDSIGQIGTLNDLWKYDPSLNQWAWIGGSTKVPGDNYGDAGVYGVLGTPAAGNNPGALFLADSWVDKGGNAWLFGGWGNDANGDSGLPINLWEFNGSAEQWAWQGGNPTFGESNPWVQASVYGTMGTPAAGNTPGTRWEGVGWTDAEGKLWLFGGDGYDTDANQGYLNESWVFDPSIKQWAWMGGDNTLYCPANADKQNCGRVGVYGTLGTAAAGNLPGGRVSASSWTGSDGHFWLFGGLGYNDTGYNLLNDLWEFDPSLMEWTWIGGDSSYQSGAGVYGTLGVPAAGNRPGARQGGVAWTGSNGDFWLFGGNAIDANGVIGLPNDLWRYAPKAAGMPAGDFAMSISPDSMLVEAGKSGSTTINVAPQNGFSTAVTFSCSGLPAHASCLFSPATVTPSGAVASSILTVYVAASTAAIRRGAGPQLSGYALAIGLCFFGLRRRRRMETVLLVVLGIASTGMLGGCGNVSHLGETTPIGQPSVSTVIVTATAGALQHTTSFSLTVN